MPPQSTTSPLPARPLVLLGGGGAATRFASVLLVALLAGAPHLCRATCVIEGDMAFAPGQAMYGSRSDGAPFPPVGLVCVNETHYEAETATCGLDDDGKVEREDGHIFACSEHYDDAPFCQQCGGRRRGGALCLPAEVGDLDCGEFEDDEYDDEGCLVGELNAAVQPGDVVAPEFITFCNDDGTYVSSETKCGENWFLDVTMNFRNSCPKGEVCTKDENDNFVCAEEEDVQKGAEPTAAPTPAKAAAPTIAGTPVCIVAGKAYQVGEVVYVEDMECQDGDDKNVPNRYKGDAFVCMEDGEVEEDKDNKDKHACPADRPYCVQCGPKELDVAVCHTEPDSDTTYLPESCADLLTEEAPDLDTSEPGCLVGDVTFLHGESMGHVGLRCAADGVSYEAVESVCGDGGVFEEASVVVRTCEGATPFCVPCGPTRQLGGALCLDRNETPPECLADPTLAPTTASPTQAPTTTSPTQAPTPEEEAGCLATYKANDVAEYVGVRCLGPDTFEALETVCLDDGSFNETTAVMDCPADDAPYCVQCGEGRALCLDANVTPPECISDDEGAEGGGGNETDGCLAGEEVLQVGQMARGGEPTSVLGCANDTTYQAVETTCGPDGVLSDKVVERTCADEKPRCVACGAGSSVCVGANETAPPEGCDEVRDQEGGDNATSVETMDSAASEDGPSNASSDGGDGGSASGDVDRSNGAAGASSGAAAAFAGRYASALLGVVGGTAMVLVFSTCALL